MINKELLQRLTMIAETAVSDEIDRLPETVRAAAAECPVFFTAMEIWGPANGAEEEDGDLLGLFSGASRLEPAPSSPDEAPKVTLFLDNLWEYCGEEEQMFAEEAATTYLHELGHYLGWDEEEVAARGLE
ncbi:MAG: metallopeptidase family protein [Verrucomicrobiota bacterium]